MSILIIKPGFTRGHVKRIFEHLVTCEVLKTSGLDEELLEGKQEGYMLCLNDLFGQSDEDILEQSYSTHKSWIHIVERIVENDLTDLVIKNQKDPFDFGDVHEKVSTAVETFLLKNMQEAMESLQSI